MKKMSRNRRNLFFFAHIAENFTIFAYMRRETERLETSRACTAVAENHEALYGFYKEQRDEMEECINTVRGKIYTPAELAAWQATNKQPVSINKALVPFRTVMGTIMQSGFDAGFLPFEESDQPLAEILGKLALFEGKRNEDTSQDAQMLQNAYITGRGYRLCYVEQGGDMEPRIASKVLSPFAVYFDPDSTDVTSRRDAQFVDVVHWLTVDEILEICPGCREQIAADIKDRNLSNEYEIYDKSANRKHEDTDELNGKRKVVERYYRVRRNGKEELWLAAWAPGLLASDQFLFNAPYHVQPMDPDTGKVMFPVVELVSDNIMGDTDGFVKFLKDPIKLVSVLFTQMMDASRHSGRAYFVNRDAFATPEEADRAIEFGANSNQRFAVKDVHNAMAPAPASQVQGVDLHALNQAQTFIEEMSSAPPALQGRQESKSTPAALNAQRIEQATTQLGTFFACYKQYLQQVLKLRYAYWRECYTDQMTFRITMPDGGQEKITLNQQVPRKGWDGLPTGEVAKINDISAAKFDIVISDSFKSPNYMKRMTSIIGEMLQSPAIAQNPPIAMLLAEELLNNSEAPQELKNRFKQQAQMQMQQQQMQTAQLAGQSQAA